MKKLTWGERIKVNKIVGKVYNDFAMEKKEKFKKELLKQALSNQKITLGGDKIKLSGASKENDMPSSPEEWAFFKQ